MIPIIFQFHGEKTTHNFASSNIFILFWCQSDHRWCPTNTSNLNLATLTYGQVKFVMEIDKNWHFYQVFFC